MKLVIAKLLRIVVAGLFLFAGFMKLTGQPVMVQEFETVGLRQWFRYATGVIEVIGAIMVLIRRCRHWEYVCSFWLMSEPSWPR